MNFKKIGRVFYPAIFGLAIMSLIAYKNLDFSNHQANESKLRNLIDANRDGEYSPNEIECFGKVVEKESGRNPFGSNRRFDFVDYLPGNEMSGIIKSYIHSIGPGIGQGTGINYSRSISD